MLKYYLVVKNGQVQGGTTAFEGEQPKALIINAVFVETNEKTYLYFQALDCLAFAKKNYSHEARVKFLKYAQNYRKQYARLLHK